MATLLRIHCRVCEVDTTRREHAKKTVEDRHSKEDASKGCDAYNDHQELIAHHDAHGR